jgi:hypothetical protein
MTLVASKVKNKNGRNEVQIKCYHYIELNGIWKIQTVFHSLKQNLISLTILKQNEQKAINRCYSSAIGNHTLKLTLNCETTRLNVLEDTNGTPEEIIVTTEVQESLSS